jgi:hypothetical protein
MPTPPAHPAAQSLAQPVLAVEGNFVGPDDVWLKLRVSFVAAWPHLDITINSVAVYD